MAKVDIVNTKLKLNEAKALTDTVAATSETEGCAVDYTGRDDGKILLILENSSESEITAKVLKGNGLQGVEDLEVEIAASGKMVLVVESGKFVNVSGDNKGKVIVNGSTSLKVAAVELP